MTEDPEVYYSCRDCVVSFVKAASNGVYVEATTDHARCSTGCRAKATFVCWVYPVERASEPVDDQKGSPEVCADPKESCPSCRYVTVTEDTLFKARKAIMQVFPSEESAHDIINEFFNAGLLIRERI